MAAGTKTASSATFSRSSSEDDDDSDYDEDSTATRTRRTAPSNRSEANSHAEPPLEAVRPQDAPQEEDGHPNVEGVLYVQPKAPFVGTYWSPVANAFLRIDRDNTSKPRGGRPQGYVFVCSINGFRRTSSSNAARRAAHRARCSEPSATSSARTSSSYFWCGSSERYSARNLVVHQRVRLLTLRGSGFD